MTKPDPLVPPPQIAGQLGVSVGYLAQMRYLGTGPRYVKIGGKAVRYRESDVTAWIEKNLRTSTADAGTSSGAA